MLKIITKEEYDNLVFVNKEWKKLLPKFQENNTKLKEVEAENKQLHKDLSNLADSHSLLSQAIEFERLQHKETMNELSNELKRIKEIVKAKNGAIGGLTKNKKEIEKKLEEKDARIKELESDSYLRRELTPEKSKITKTMGIKNTIHSQSVKKILKEKK